MIYKVQLTGNTPQTFREIEADYVDFDDNYVVLWRKRDRGRQYDAVGIFPRNVLNSVTECRRT